MKGVKIVGNDLFTKEEYQEIIYAKQVAPFEIDILDKKTDRLIMCYVVDLEEDIPDFKEDLILLLSDHDAYIRSVIEEDYSALEMVYKTIYSSRDEYFMKHKLTKDVLEFLSNQVVEWNEYGMFEVTISMKNVNLKINGKSWDSVMKEFLEGRGYNKIQFIYGKDNWVTIAHRG